MATLIVPGLNGSGPEHWQSWWEAMDPDSRRVEQHPWHVADLPRWSRRVAEALTRAPEPVWIVAHSFGCLASVHASQRDPGRVAGAFLVAPADPDRFGVADQLPQGPLPFPTAVVASTHDPWMSLSKTTRWAKRWGSHLINAGPVGHINVDSGHGPWRGGLALFLMLRTGAPLPDHVGDLAAPLFGAQDPLVLAEAAA